LLLGALGCADPPLDCDYYGFDLFNQTGRNLFVEFDTDEAGYFSAELSDAPTEVHNTRTCSKDLPTPADLPPMLARYLDESEDRSYRLELPPEAWSALKTDPNRGYEFYRAEIFAEDLVLIE
jgi:hypothetical protein